MVCKVLSFYITGLFCIAGGERKHDHRAPDSLERLNSQLKDPQFISDTQWSDTCSIISRYEIDRELRPEPGQGETGEDSEQEAEKVPETPSLFAAGVSTAHRG